MSLRYLAGFITASYNPLKVPNAPTITTVTAGNTQLTVAFTAPANVGGGAITSYIAIAQTSAGVVTSTTGSASPITITGLSNGTAYTVQVAAVNAFGPGPYSTGTSGTPISATLWTWGDNLNGGLGQNIYYLISRSSPVQVGSSSNWYTISGAVNSTNPTFIAVDLTNKMYVWGNNTNGNLGLNDTSINRSSPVQLGALTTWRSASGGEFFNCIIKTDNTIWAMGYNFNGECARNNLVTASSPVQIGALTDWSKSACGQNHTIAVKTDGTLWSWGKNTYGQLGQNNTINRSSPVQIGADVNWSNVACGLYHSLAIKTTGTIWAWGRGNSGQLGDNTVYNRSSPVQIGALTTWSVLKAGQYATFAIKTDGTMWSWGGGFNGMSGQNNTTNLSSPVQIGAGTTWLNVTCGYAQGLATKTDGTLWSWGYNNKGQLGKNNIANTSSPVQIGSNTNWNIVAASFNTSLAFTK